MFGKIFKGISKIAGPILGVAGTALGQPWMTAAGSALGAWNQNREARDAAGRQMRFQADMSNSSYQRAMQDMKLAGLNPILAYQQGGASAPSGASYSPTDVGSSAASGGVKGAQTRNLLEQNNNLQANSALQRMQTQQAYETTRRTKLENDAYSTLPPHVRAMVLSGSSAGSLTSAGHTIGKALRPAGKAGASAAKNVWSFINPKNLAIPFRR